MQWIAPSEKDVATDTLEKRLWDAADQFRANSGLTSAQYSQPVLGLIFLRFAEVRFAAQRAKLEKVSASSRRGSRVDEPAAYHADGVLYLVPNSRFDYLRDLPEAADAGKIVNEAMRDIEKHNPQLRRRAAQDLQPLHQHAAQRTAEKGLRRSQPRWITTPSGESTNIFSASSPDRKARRAASFIPRLHRPTPHRSYRAISRPHPRSRLRLGRHVRLIARASCPSTRRTPRPNSPFTASRKPTRPDGSAA